MTDLNKIKSSGRIASIDVFRALTMLLMIWVNDFWTLENIPKWLEHAHADEDYLGFSDLIFPWFLFIVGLSIPFAINIRLRKGDSKAKILWHILLRSVALLIMGVVLVNLESYHAGATGMAKPWFVILSVSAIFLVWNVYPKVSDWRRYLFTGLQILGIALLVFLAYFYRGTDYDDSIVRFQPRWWGILGLIGWTYIVAAPLYLFLRNVRYSMWACWLAFIALNIIGSSGVQYNIFSWQSGNWIVGNGAFHAFAFGGIVTSQLLIRFRNRRSPFVFYGISFALALICLVAGIYSNEFFIKSKIGATPPWIFFCLSTAFVLFILLHWLVDYLGKKDWFSVIKIAGTATLTCYLIPYFVYSFYDIFDLNAPDIFTTGWLGLIKSMTYAFAVIGIAWILVRLSVKLKI